MENRSPYRLVVLGAAVISVCSLIFYVDNLQAGFSPSITSQEYCARLAVLVEQGALAQVTCGIVRGSKKEKKIALVFTGGNYADGFENISNALTQVKGKASFFLTGNFLRTSAYASIVRNLKRKGHYIGAHSNRHYEPIDEQNVTKISEIDFHQDLQANLAELRKFGISTDGHGYWILPNEAYNQELAEWSIREGLTVINFTKGTRSNADFTEDHESNFVSNEEILKSILDFEAQNPDGLNGFLLLFHLGAGPLRSKLFSPYLGDLFQNLNSKGYTFVRIDTLLEESLAPIFSKP